MSHNSEEFHTVDDEAFVPAVLPTYNEAFPPLERSDSPGTFAFDQGQWNKKLSLKSSTTTQVFCVPLEERRFKEMNEQQFGDSGHQAKICQEIMQKVGGVSIEMSLAKDESLTVVIHGKQDDVMKARRMVVNQLQTQASISIPIPREHHRFLLGKNGKKLQELELTTATKISIPRPEDNSDMVRIVGTKEGIDKARHEIQIISDEQAKLAFERLPVPKVYHPFIVGPNSTLLNQMQETTGVRINVPPPSVMKDDIIISGEKEGVHAAVNWIKSVYQEKERKCQTVSVEVRKSQHKYVIGPRGSGLHEILQQSGVSVEVPPLDNISGTITLRGEPDKLGPALTLVYAKANSVIIAEVDAPCWLHRFIIGRQGANVRKITQDLPKVHIEFNDGEDKIQVEGPPDEVEKARLALEEITQDLRSRMDYAELKVDPKYHRHIIGKNGVNVTRIKNETGVSIRIPPDADKNNLIRIEGDPQGVAKAKQELLDMVQKMENERTRDILIEQRFHKTIIGAKGGSIRDIRDKFNQVQITFPDPGKKSDVVTIRGPKTDVDQVYKYLLQMHQNLIAENYQAEVHIFKKFHKNIIGKGGLNIKKIREETDTKIDLPSENSDSDIILITGKKANVEAAKQKIEQMQKVLANVSEITIEIPHKLHNSIIGAKGHLIRSIMEECGGVNIRFPPEGTNNDKVLIRGPKDDVENAKKQLLDLSQERKESGYTAEVKARAEYHKFLIGRGGANIKKVRDNTGARVIFPAPNDSDQELIVIIGKKESVEKAKEEIEGLVKNLENITEGEVNVDPKHHRHFVARRGEVLRHIADDYGGVTVSFPRSGVKSDRVVLKGAKDCVEGAKKRILEIVEDLENQVTIECVISQKHHRTVMGAKGHKVQEITRDFEVGIKFPDRPIPQQGGGDAGEDLVANGDANSEGSVDSDTPRKCDIITISGKKEKCEAAKNALLNLVPITEDTNVPFKFHRFIIGARGKDVRKMMEDYDVSISVPPPDQESDLIKVTGPPDNVRRAQEALLQKVEELEKIEEDRALKSYKISFEVDPSYHPKIIGRKGQVISKIRQQFDVQIQFPERTDDENAQSQGVIEITGYEQSVNGAKEEIMKIVRSLDNRITEEVILDNRIHARLIGHKGIAIRKTMDKYNVDIRFPRTDSSDPDVVLITGEEDNVLDCKDELLNLAEEFEQDLLDKEMMRQYIQPSRKEAPQRSAGNRGFAVRDAPWDKTPDTNSTDDFPTIGAATAPSPNFAWGPARR